MTIYLQRKVGKPSISFEFEPGVPKALSISDVVKLADVHVYQANPDGSVAKDFNQDLAFIINNEPLPLVSLATGLNTIHLGIKYGANKVQDLQMPIEIMATEKEEEITFSFTPEPQPEPVVEKEEPVFATTEEPKQAPTKFEPTPVLNSRLEQGDVYVFYGDLLLGEQGPVISKIPTLTVKIEDLLSNEEQEKIENFEKIGLKVYPIGVDGFYHSDKNLVTQGFDVDDEGKVTWVSPYTQPLSFTNQAFSPTGFVGLRYELSFIPKFKPEPEVTALNNWNDIFDAQPVTEKEETPAPAVGDWGSAFAQPEPVVQPEPVAEVKPEPIVPPKPEPMVVGNYETPVSDGWGQVQSEPKPEPQVQQQNPVDEMGNLNLNFQDVQAKTTQKVTGDTYGGGMTPPLITPQVSPTQSAPQNSAFEQFTGETLSMTPPLLHLQPNTSGTNSAMNPNPGMNPNVGAVQPQTPTSDEDLDLQLEEVTQGTRKSKQGFLEKIFGTFKRSKKKKGGKGVIIGSVAMGVLTIGIGTGVVLYRNAGINSMKSTTQLVEKNLSKVNKLMKDKEITSEESVEIQQLITENANKLEAKTNNYFAEMERKRLVSATNEVTEKAKDMIDKQTGASSSASE